MRVQIFYNLLLIIVQPIVLLRLLWRSLRAPEYRRRVPERYGCYPGRPAAAAPCIWVHAVSVGETVASVPLIRGLLRDYPRYPLLVTTMTPTGSERVRALLGDAVAHVYAPYDLPGAVDRFLRHFRPCLLIIVETELWPNMIRRSHRQGVPVVLANARLSSRSAAGYRRVGRLTRGMLEALDAAAIQTQAEAERFVALGLPPSRAVVTGNMKFDMPLSEADRAKAARWRAAWQREAPVWVAASTHEGEEAIVLAAHAALLDAHPGLLLILVPRHPERFDEAVAMSEALGLRSWRLSSGRAPAADVQVLVGDTMGDLLALFGVADIAFVGGSLIERGGHNVLEPALWSIPVLSGPHIFNFLEIGRMMEQAGGLLIVADGEALQGALARLLADPRRRAEVGRCGHRVVADNRGALARLQAVVAGLLPPQ